jgi:hypothetical protein
VPIIAAGFNRAATASWSITDEPRSLRPFSSPTASVKAAVHNTQPSRTAGTSDLLTVPRATIRSGSDLHRSDRFPVAELGVVVVLENDRVVAGGPPDQRVASFGASTTPVAQRRRRRSTRATSLQT